MYRRHKPRCSRLLFGFTEMRAFHTASRISLKQNCASGHKKMGCLTSHYISQKGTDFVAQHSDVVSCESKSSANDLTDTEPRVQLNAKERGNASVLNIQIISVSPQLLHLIKLFPECFVATRLAERSMCQYKDTSEDVKEHLMT